MGRRHHSVAVGALVAIVALVSGCGSSRGLDDQQRAQRVRDYAYLPSARAVCAGATCWLRATTRLHSKREAFLIAWPLVFGDVRDPSLNLRLISLKLSDPKTGAILRLNCNPRRAGQIPDGVTSVTTVKQHCGWSWRASY